MFESKWFWLLAGAVAVRAWEAHAAKACLGERPYAKAFSFGNATNTVFEISGAGCGGGNCPPPAACPERAPCPTQPVGCGTC